MKRAKQRKYLFMGILMMMVGFAAVTTTLVINGTLGLLGDTSSFDGDVVFTKAKTEKGGVAVIDEETSKTITFTSRELSGVNESTTLYFDITNKSRQYDAVASINCNTNAGVYADYVTVVPNKTAYEVNASETVSGSLSATLVKAIAQEEGIDVAFTCTITATAKEREAIAPQYEDKRAVVQLKKLAETDTENMALDDTADHNLRYVGKDPNNYVNFNGEKWRIIGVMNGVKDADGNEEPKVKLVRAEYLGAYSWDNKANGVGTSLSDRGSNDWTDSALMTSLNTLYLNRESGNCPSGANGATKACDFTSNGLSEEAKKMLSKATWNLGGIRDFNNGTARLIYSSERSNDVFAREPLPTEWNGYVALLHASDYGYAVGGTVRDTCLSTALYNWDTNTNCMNNDWLLESYGPLLLMNPASYNSDNIFCISHTDGSVMGTGNGAVSAYVVTPTVYLNEDVKIVNGTGTSEDPFELSL